jgi:hypothetical protein
MARTGGGSGAGPVMDFETVGRARECLSEWQERLFLQDWVIGLDLADELQIDGDDTAGTNEYNTTLKCSVITIRRHKGDESEMSMKVCHEHVLVHELLHLKYNWQECDALYESKYVDACEHALLEQMAKSLIMAKYNLTFGWFRNF